MRNKALKERLGDPETLPSTREAKAQIAQRMTDRLQEYIHQAQDQIKQQVQPYIQKKRTLQHQHQNERERLKGKQEERWQQESIARSQRLPRGFKGIWHRITGKYQKIRDRNEAETEKYRIRDRDQKQNLIERQLTQRQKLQEQIQPILQDHKLKMHSLKQDIARYMELGETPPKTLQEEFGQVQPERDIDQTPEM